MRRIAFLALAVTLTIAVNLARAQSVDVDAVILADTSASMIDDLDAVCRALPDVLQSIRDTGLNVQARVVGVKDRYACAEDTVRTLLPDASVVTGEDWGQAVAVLSEGHAWQSGATRLLIPLSDAGPASGDPVDDPGPDRDAATRAIRAAVAHGVILSPLLTQPEPDVSPDDRARLEALAQDMASKTGGRVFLSAGPSDLPEAISQLITSAVETPTGLTAIAAAIPTPAKLSLDPGILATNAVLAALAAVLTGLTTALLSEAFGRQQERRLPSNRVTDAIGSLGRRVSRAFTLASTPTAWRFGSARVLRAATIVVLTAFFALTALIASFLDPNFQPNTAIGVGTFITLLIALVVVNLVAAFAGGSAARTRQVTPGLQVRPGAVLLVAAGVAISRGINFLPGYLIGLPAGLVLIGPEPNRDHDAAVGRASVFAAIGVGLAAWLLAWPVEALSAGLSGSPGSGAASLALTVTGGLQSTLLTIFLIAAQFALLELFPIRATLGRLWFSQRRLIWGVAFGVVTFGALQTLFNPNRSGLDALRNPGLLPLAAVIATYSGVTLVAWLLTNESRIRGQGKVNRRSALTAGVLIVAWLGGLACVALADVASTISPTTVLIVAVIAVALGAGAWLLLRRRAGPPPSQS